MMKIEFTATVDDFKKADLMQTFLEENKIPYEMKASKHESVKYRKKPRKSNGPKMHPDTPLQLSGADVPSGTLSRYQLTIWNAIQKTMAGRTKGLSRRKLIQAISDETGVETGNVSGSISKFYYDYAMLETAK